MPILESSAHAPIWSIFMGPIFVMHVGLVVSPRWKVICDYRGWLYGYVCFVLMVILGCGLCWDWVLGVVDGGVNEVGGRGIGGMRVVRSYIVSYHYGPACLGVEFLVVCTVTNKYKIGAILKNNISIWQESPYKSPYVIK